MLGRLILCLTYVLVSYVALGQIKIQGIITDLDNNPVVRASVVLKKLDKQSPLAYTITGPDGQFELTAEPGLTYTLEINHISFLKKEVGVPALQDRENHYKISLEQNNKRLDEVTVIAKAAATQRGDTISYNLDLFTTGNEQKLKDVIAKLPGLEINDNGKITAHGKVIDDLLVNGKKMFGNNHQMATENINAEMLAGIDLLNNFEDFAAIKEIEGSDKKALNIQIKEEYLGRISGNVEGYIAHEKRYKAHGNFFRFGSNGNISSIIDLNNTGEQALSLRNFIDMSRGVKQDMRNNDASLLDANRLPSIPDFLARDNNVATKQSEFASFDVGYQIFKNLSLNGFSILNFSRSQEFIRSEKIFLNPSGDVRIFESQQAGNAFLFNQTKLNVDYKPNANNLINYSVLFDPNNARRTTSIQSQIQQDTTVFNERDHRVNYQLGQQLSYIRRLSKNKLLSFNAFQEITVKDINYKLDGNRSLFNTSLSLIFQEKAIKENELGVFAKYTHKIQKHILRVNMGYIKKNNHLFIDSDVNQTQNSPIDVSMGYWFSDAAFIKKTGFWQYRFKGEFRQYQTQRDLERRQINQFLPSAQLKLAFTDLHSLTLAYRKDIDFPQVDNINDVTYVNDFRNIVIPSQLFYLEQFVQHTYTLNYSRFNLYSGTVLFANASLTRSNNFYTRDTRNLADYNETQNLVSPAYTTINSNITFEQRINALHSKFKLNGGYVHTENYNYISSLENRFRTNIYTFRSTLNSTFDSPTFNFDVGFFASHQTTTNSLSNIVNGIERWAPLLNIHGRIRGVWRYFINNSYEQFYTSDTRRNYYDLGGKIMYQKAGNRMRYWAEGVNLLNIRNPEIIQIYAQQNQLSTDVIQRIAGYIGLGISVEL